MKKPKVLSTQMIFKGFFDVKQDLLEREDGETLPYTSLLLSTYATAILAQDLEGKWILNREYRHPTGGYILGCPGGRVEKGEDLIKAAQRELFEESGYWAEELVQIGISYPLPSISSQKILFFWAKGAYKKGEGAKDPFEYIETELKTDEELRKEIRCGENVDSILIAALWYKDHFSPSTSL